MKKLTKFVISNGFLGLAFIISAPFLLAIVSFAAFFEASYRVIKWSMDD